MPATWLCLNEDDSHFFSSRAGTRPGVAEVEAWVDQYAGTQVRELMLCPNCMRTSYASEVWDPIWRGYDPHGPDDQALFASLAPAARAAARGWVHTAWQLHQDGIDVYRLWIDRARRQGLVPWLSMRMNDIHNVDDEQSFIHSEFWRNNPQFRRVPYRFADWRDRAFDYGRAEVREYHLRLIRELAARYDFDGLELDWMRFGYHFRPGHERAGATLLTDFTREVRRLLDDWQQRRGHRIALGARVPSRPQTALGLGMDAVGWARQGLLDMLVVTPFWATIEPDMPLETWRDLLADSEITLAAGLELMLRPHPAAPAQPNSLATVRGAAAALLQRGAGRIYLFNYMDSETAMADLGEYRTVLQEAGSLDALAGKPRRHVLTYPDTWAPGEPRAIPLPATASAGRWLEFRLPTGPSPSGGEVEIRLHVTAEATGSVSDWEVRLNGKPCAARGMTTAPAPSPAAPLYRFQAPASAIHEGYNLVELLPTAEARLEWVEIALA